MWGAFPPRNLWWLGLVALGLLYAAIVVGRPRARVGAFCGLVFGLCFWLPLLPWIGVYVGPLPWVALSVALAIYGALFGATAVVTARLPGAPVWFALCWIAVEWARSSFPFGGFPWGATAFGQVGSPLLPVAALGGVPLLGFVIALTAAGLAQVVIVLARLRRSGTTGSRRNALLRPVATALLCALAGPIVAAAMWPSVHAADDRGPASSRVTVAAVQGNVPRLGLDFAAQRRAVLDNHVRETFRLADAIRAGTRPRPDLVLWPENASDIDPLDNEDAAEEITAASQAVGAPILVGTLIRNDDGRPTNTVLVWDGARGPVGRYDKHIVQPFGEYLPWRPFFRMFSSYADQAGNFRPGDGRSVLTVPVDGRSQPAPVGVSTCWEIAFDRSPREAVDQGAQLLYVPTNNATFGRTQMTYQQLAMSQVRAVELGRTVVVAATTGVSAVVAPDGRLLQRSQFFTPATLSADITLRTDRTPAARLGALPQTVLVVIAVAGFLVALATRTRLGKHLRPAGRPEGAAPGAHTAEEIDDVTDP
ncbi:apolipoprotein N-acyltransferase [Williamsia deligens]|nr:apolipoprotein N-acyltransferase [Williamsia deligens]